jgi:hypothetical protein
MSAGQVLQAFLRQREAARGALEQACAKFGLQRRKAAHDGGQRHVEGGCRRGEVAVVGDLHEGLHGAKLVHRAILIRWTQQTYVMRDVYCIR